MYKQVHLAIAAVGSRNGASRAEVMLTPDGQCTVTEIGSRIGAGHIGFLVLPALGVDPGAPAWTPPWVVRLSLHLALPPFNPDRHATNQTRTRTSR